MGAYALALLAGVISFSWPCCLPLMPGYVSNVSGTAEAAVENGGVALRSRMLATGGLFVLGFALVFTAMGASISGVGSLLLRHRAGLTQAAGVLVTLFGLVNLGLLRIPFLYRERRFDMRRISPGSRGGTPAGDGVRTGMDSLHRPGPRRDLGDRRLIDLTALRRVLAPHLRARARPALLPPGRGTREEGEGHGLASAPRSRDRGRWRRGSRGHGNPDDHGIVGATVRPDPPLLLEERMAAALTGREATVTAMNRSPGCLDPGREAMLLAALPVRRAAFQCLLSGHPTSVAEIAAASGVSEESGRRAAQDVAHVGMAELDGSTVVAMDGLTTRRTQHCITLDDVDLCTWCAYDIVGIAAALGSDATGTTQCGTCGREIAVEIRGGDPGESPVVGWLPEDVCTNVMAEFCPSALFFCSPQHLEVWRLRRGAGPGEALDLRALAERGREEWAQLVASPAK